MMPNLEAAFNDKIPYPKLLADFERWAKQFEGGTFGLCRFETDKLDDYWIENGSQLANHFALWLHLTDGSMIGFWRPKNFADDDILPIVQLGSEGEQEVLADSLEDFLYKWAEGVDLGSADELHPMEQFKGIEFKFAEMLNWLEQNQIQKPIVKKKVSSEDLVQFFSDWQSNQK